MEIRPDLGKLEKQNRSEPGDFLYLMCVETRRSRIPLDPCINSCRKPPPNYLIHFHYGKYFMNKMWKSVKRIIMALLRCAHRFVYASVHMQLCLF
jgi:hypothetical protein